MAGVDLVFAKTDFLFGLEGGSKADSLIEGDLETRGSGVGPLDTSVETAVVEAIEAPVVTVMVVVKLSVVSSTDASLPF